jgi:Glycine-rich domain-containing protein-like
LEKASKFKVEWRQSSIIKQMITRYYRFMQLKASCPNNILLIPTLDIEIIWQTHLLRPEMYREDCMRLFHRIIDHSLLTNDIEQFLKEQAFIDTCKLYKERFGEEYCPLPEHKNDEPIPPKYEHPVFGKLKCLIPIYSYWDKTHFTFSSESSCNYNENPFSFTEADIILDGNWLDLCKKFMKEMISKTPIQGYYRKSDQIDLSTSAIKRLKKSYERFLYMATKYPPSNGYDFVHPTYAVRGFSI